MYVFALHKSFVEELRRSRAKSAFDQALFALASGVFCLPLATIHVGGKAFKGSSRFNNSGPFAYKKA